MSLKFSIIVTFFQPLGENFFKKLPGGLEKNALCAILFFVVTATNALIAQLVRAVDC